MRTKLIGLLILTALVGAVLIHFREWGTLQPFKRFDPYTNIFQVATDADGALYAITDSKQIIRKVDSGDKLVYAVSSGETGSSGAVRLFDGIAADADGYAYALVTILDENGLKVTGEQIVRISPDGSRMHVMHEVEYPPEDNLLRVGRIQALSVKEGELYFFRREETEASLLKLPVTAEPGTKAETVRTFEMPENRYLKELTGNDANRFFFTTKRGSLYAVTGQNAAQLSPAAATGRLNFPVEIVTEDHARLFYIDHHDAAVYRIDTTRSGSAPEPVLTADELARGYPDIEWSEFADIALSNGRVTVATFEHIIELDAAGNIAAVREGYRYPLAVMAMRTAYWLVCAWLVYLIFAIFRFVYVHLLRRKVYLLLKHLLAILPIVLASMIFLSYSVYNSFSAEMKTSIRNQLELLAVNGKFLVSGDNLENLDSPRDYMNEDYQAIKSRIREVFSTNGEDRDGLYNTIYRYMNGNLYIVMDDDDSVTMFKPFPLSEENIQVLTEGRVVSGEWKDASGEWIYALGPIYNSRGDVVGIYETGKDLIGVSKSNFRILSNMLKVFALIGVILLVAIALMTFLLLSSIGKLRRYVNLVASGEWDARVDIRTRDEVAELGERFNMMADSIRRYIREVTRLSNAYFRFVPQQFLKVLGKTNMTEVQLGEQQKRRMTVLVCYMRNFPEFSAKLTTEENFRFINSFLKTFGPVIREFGGFTSRYLGPGMLSMFPNHPVSALKAAGKLRAVLEEYNGRRAQSGYEPVEIGIAIHTGDVMLGIIGEEQRLEGSVVSHHVQMTLDLERISAKLGVFVLITEDMLRESGAIEGHCRRLGLFKIDEDQPPVELYDWFEGDPAHIRKLKSETKSQFEAAVEAFQQGRFYEAREGFVAVVKKNRYDLAAKMYFFECDKYYQTGISEEWNYALRIS